MNDFKKIIGDLRKHLMTGVSYMIPFVVAGGITLAVSVLLSGTASVPSEGILGGLATIGIAGLSIIVPILAGYIAFSMADRPGIAPGVIGGIIANDIGAGFIGGLIAGLLAGYVVNLVKKIKLPASLRSLMSIFIIPLLGSLIVGGIMYFVIGTPIASLMSGLTSWLESLGTGNLAVLGLLLGAMIGSDLGGPINKVAFGFGSAMVGTINPLTGMPSETALTIMGGIGVAICVPPLAMGLATLIAPKKFSVEEKDSGKAALVMGLVGISEGAIPFAAADPMRVIPANIIGSSVGAAVTMFFASGNPAPWGGWIVLPVVTNPFGYIVGTAAGVGVTALITVLLKKEIKKDELVEEEEIDTELEIDFDFL